MCVRVVRHRASRGCTPRRPRTNNNKNNNKQQKKEKQKKNREINQRGGQSNGASHDQQYVAVYGRGRGARAKTSAGMSAQKTKNHKKKRAVVNAAHAVYRVADFGTPTARCRLAIFAAAALLSSRLMYAKRKRAIKEITYAAVGRLRRLGRRCGDVARHGAPRASA